MDCSSSSRFDCFKQHFTVGALLARLRNLVQSILRFPEGQSELKLRSLPSLKAAFVAAPVPHKVMICAKLVISSYALKNGYLPLSMQRKMTPADHMSTAGDCWGYFRSTSGERNPGVPARGVFWWPLYHTKEWDCVSEVEDTCRIKIKCILENWTRTRPHYAALLLQLSHRPHTFTKTQLFENTF